MKHGRKEQFSITIDTETATKFYAYQEKHDILFKNMAMEQLLQKAFLHIELMKNYDNDQLALFMEGSNLMKRIVMELAPKNGTLKKAIKVHYDTLLDTFRDAKIKLKIN